MPRSGGPTVGLDIGSKMIKVAQLEPGRNGVVVRALGMAPTPPGAMDNGVVVDAQLLAQAVKQLLRSAGVTAKTSVSSVSGQGALVVRVIEVPKMSDSELAETMKWEVERHVPFAANEVIMDFQPIVRADTPEDAPNMEVLMAVAQQDMIDNHCSMLMAAGLKPVAIDVEPLAAARSLIELGPNPYGQRTTIIVNIGAANTDIGVFRDGILSFPRTLPLAGDMLTNAIANQMGVAEEQAEELKKKYGEVILEQVGQPSAPADAGFLDFAFGGGAAAPAEPTAFDFSAPDTEPTGAAPETAPGFDLGGGQEAAPAQLPTPVDMDPTKAAVCTAIAPVLGELLTELRRSIEYYRGRSGDGRIDEILLCGGTANLPSLDQFLASELGIPTRVANPFQFTTVAARNYSAEYLQEIAPLFAVAVGLAARDMVQAPVPAGAGGKRKK